jgi:hypothetical protein
MFEFDAQSQLTKIYRSINQNRFAVVFNQIETRSRLSFVSSDKQVSQSQPIEGTPVDVPVPRKVSFIMVNVNG